uniref:Protein kinase domain-containing protein n=1 Tax=Coccolithus braarudii TaxID=221442 RepID=A0A7S0LQ12_9EUKA|mmetsp:Transcript_48441/g.103352  ORF Transcript_48441/g.103352 Transcript_48441/m.103352 type:complete len:213 (+) Transcript_48441:579-1217(+)
MVRQILSGIAFLHSRWIMHRDLSPSNILVFDGQRLKITDFGLARTFWAPLTPLSADGPVVKVWYRAPELLLGQKDYGAAIDVWALGCIFVELLLMRVVFRGHEAKNGRPQMHQLGTIFESLGVPDEQTWPGHTSLPLWRDALHAGILGKGHDGRKSLRAELRALDEETHPGDAGMEVLKQLLRYCPKRRPTAQRALESDLFSGSCLHAAAVP